jgi:hypothetical protein
MTHGPDPCRAGPVHCSAKEADGTVAQEHVTSDMVAQEPVAGGTRECGRWHCGTWNCGTGACGTEAQKPVARNIVAQEPVARNIVAQDSVARNIVAQEPVAGGRHKGGNWEPEPGAGRMDRWECEACSAPCYAGASTWSCFIGRSNCW